MISKPKIYKLFRDFVSNKKATNNKIVFSCRPVRNVLNYKGNRWDLPTIWKKCSLRNIWKVVNNSELFTTTPGMQPERDAMEESRLFMTFFTNIGVQE